MKTKFYRTAVFIVFAAGLCQGAAYALADYAGTSGAQFLKFGAGSRAGGMADAYSALADDVYSGYYNPAGLTKMTSPEFAGQHVTYFQDTNYEFMSFAYPFDKQDGYSRQAVGISVYNMSVTEMERRTEDTDLAAGLFDASNMAYALSYSYRMAKYFGIGGTVKYVREKIDAVSAGAAAFDVGIQMRPLYDRPLDVAVGIRNFGSKLKYNQGSDPLPVCGVLGLGYTFLPGLRADIDFIKYRDTNTFFAAGAEYSRKIMQKLSGALRFGYTNHYRNIDGLKGISSGAGLQYSKFNVDFAWVPFGDLGNTFRYTLSVRF